MADDVLGPHRSHWCSRSRRSPQWSPRWRRARAPGKPWRTQNARADDRGDQDAVRSPDDRRDRTRNRYVFRNGLAPAKGSQLAPLGAVELVRATVGTGPETRSFIDRVCDGRTLAANPHPNRLRGTWGNVGDGLRRTETAGRAQGGRDVAGHAEAQR